jgi:hypothetical protein
MLKLGKTEMSVDSTEVVALGEKLEDWVALESAMRDDVIGILDLLDRWPQNQSLRRAFVRTLWGFIDGSVHGLGDFLRTASTLSAREFGREEKRTINRIKSTLKDGGSLLANWKRDFGTSGWEALQKSLSVRNRLMHPKIASEVMVSDDQVATAKEGAAWFLTTIIEIQNRAAQRVRR